MLKTYLFFWKDVFQDSKGNIWFGTQDGAFQYNEKSLIHIDSIKCDLGRGVAITDITEDEDGRIWFGHSGGISVFDGETISNYHESDGLKTSFVNQVIEDKNGSFWISTSKGLFNYSDTVLKNITEGITEHFKGTGSIIQDSNGDIWFNSNLRDIYSFHEGGFSKYRITEDEYGPAPFEIYEDQQKRLWFVGFGGAYRFENDTFINVTQYGPF